MGHSLKKFSIGKFLCKIIKFVGKSKIYTTLKTFNTQKAYPQKKNNHMVFTEL